MTSIETTLAEIEDMFAARGDNKYSEAVTQREHALQAAQQTTKSAHIVLTGINAIKPSEVRRPARGGGAGPKKKKSKP